MTERDTNASGGILGDYLSDGTNMYQKEDAEKKPEMPLSAFLSGKHRITLRGRRKNISSAVASAAFAARVYGVTYRFNMDRMPIANNDRNKISLKKRLSDIQTNNDLKEVPYRNDFLLSGYLGESGKGTEAVFYFAEREAPVSKRIRMKTSFKQPDMIEPAKSVALNKTVKRRPLYEAVNRTWDLYASVRQKENNAPAKTDMMSALKKIEEKKSLKESAEISVLQTQLQKNGR